MVEQKSSVVYTHVDNPIAIRKEVLGAALETANLLKKVGQSKVMKYRMQALQDLKIKVRDIRRSKLSFKKSLPVLEIKVEKVPELHEVHNTIPKKIERPVIHKVEHKLAPHEIHKKQEPHQVEPIYEEPEEIIEDINLEENYESKKLADEIMNIQKKLHSIK
ncbi:MAG: hypothetical protein PHD81_02640 [Candidatus Nanoarchaeia archaeon]|nr:hypothetical protein [Candidatus Nanoarchaeia archaeon]MDD5587983.1 hypothetical protein [Candidatus Nanoarchaeia archaeon]